jgi:hypothetical protein
MELFAYDIQKIHTHSDELLKELPEYYQAVYNYALNHDTYSEITPTLWERFEKRYTELSLGIEPQDTDMMPVTKLYFIAYVILLKEYPDLEPELVADYKRVTERLHRQLEPKERQFLSQLTGLLLAANGDNKLEVIKQLVSLIK